MSVLNFATSPNSGVKFLGGFLRSEKTIFRFIFSGGASFSWHFIFRLLRSRHGCLVKPSLRVQIIPWTALQGGTTHAFLLVTQTVEGYGPILSIRLLHMLSPMDILKNWFIPGQVPPIDGNFP